MPTADSSEGTCKKKSILCRLAEMTQSERDSTKMRAVVQAVMKL
jgi:hypothetical protein